MFMVNPPHATAKLVAAAYDAGVRVLNLTKVIDLILRRENILEGVVVNWSPVEYAGHDAVHVDPIALESKVVVDATGHDAAVVALLKDRKSTRLNSSHSQISYAVFCLKKKKKQTAK